MKTFAYGTSFLLAFAIGGWDTDSFSLATAVTDGLLTTLVVAVVLAAAIAFSPIALTGGLTWAGTACAVALVSVVCGLIVGTASGLGNGAEIAKGKEEEAKKKKEDEDEVKRIEKIRSVSHYIDVYFEPRDDDDSQAKDFVCLFVAYDDTRAGKPERKTRIVADNAGDFFNDVRNHLEDWLIRRLKQDAGREQRVYTLRAFTEDPYPGDGTYTQFKMISEQKHIKVIRNESKWTSAIP